MGVFSMQKQTSSAVPTPSHSSPLFPEPKCPHELLLVRWWRDANSGPNPPSWNQVSDWCHGASMAAKRFAGGASVSSDYSILSDVAFVHELMASAPELMSQRESGRASVGLLAIMLCCALAFGAVSVARSQIINAVIKEAKLTAGQTAEGGIAEYNQVLRLVVDGRAEIAAGQPHGYTWRCLDEKAHCVVKAVAP